MGFLCYKNKIHLCQNVGSCHANIAFAMQAKKHMGHLFKVHDKIWNFSQACNFKKLSGTLNQSNIP